MDWKTLFFSANGRIGQKDFWLGFLILLGIGVVAKFIPLVNLIEFFVSAYCWTCLTSKRLHDIGKTGWLAAIPFVATVVVAAAAIWSVGIVAAEAIMKGEPGAAALSSLGAFIGISGLAAILCLGFLLWVGVSAGEPGDNRYGPANPRSLFDAPLPPAEPPPPATVA